MVEESTLMRAAEKAPPDEPTPLLVAADWLDENGKPELAFALRWCAARGRRPYHRSEVKRYPWQWVRDQKYYRWLTRAQVSARTHAVLPAAVFDLMPDSADAYVFDYKTAAGAYGDLAAALAELRAAFHLPDLPPVVARPAEVKLVCCPGCGVARSEFAPRCPVCDRQEG